MRLHPAVNGLTFRPVRPDEIVIAVQQFLDAFGITGAAPGDREAEFRGWLTAGGLWGVDADGRLVGHCRLRAVEHFFGGRPVRCLEVAGVAVPAEHRRRGVATAMMEGAAAWGSHQSLGLSLLYPAVPELYRRLGWEFAGTFPSYALRQQAVPGAEPLRPAVPADAPLIAACHERHVAALNGPARRDEARWRRLLQGKAQYVLDGADGLDAYVLLYEGADPDDGGSSLDWAATTTRGLRAVAAQCATLAEQGAAVRGLVPDLLTLSASTWGVLAGGGLHWMARTLVLPAAVAQRGFASGVDAAVTFAVDDRVVGESRGPWRLEVSGGRGALTPAGDAEVVLDVRATGPLYTGFRSATQLAAAGLLDGPRGAVEALDAMFAGTPPVLLDFF